jgi:hypothetical protein
MEALDQDFDEALLGNATEAILPQVTLIIGIEGEVLRKRVHQI